jgi:methionine synthase II (cobalamin-independent)
MTLSFPADPLLPEQMENVARIVEDEVLDMASAGAREIQLDAPFEAILLLVESRKPQDIAPWIVHPFRRVEGVRRTIHFCLGDMGRRPATQEQHLRNLIPLIQCLDGAIDRVHLECSYTGQWEERDLLSEIPESMEVIAGIADVKAEPQSSEILAGQIATLRELLPDDRLLVSSSCGCGRVPHDDAIRMMSNLVEAAHSCAL